MTRDRPHTGFAAALRSGGLLGQVEGRTVADALARLSTLPLTWRKAIRYVAVDMSALSAGITSLTVAAASAVACYALRSGPV
ncbi:hypothetical protein GCM10023084_10200 [Streptomyces lacrimifluminis]|uniref:Uncharacterized protein n=1 Tax=Streptomyces lacrimifluminis TaxID=1500077 RepID=A0A917L5X4_9ACTN|nr:hypothetical protein GCM10012282_49360 [Streptomyces lacrimifluminis]